ncbi:MAG: GerMN domain-containing protein [Spirochaetaceae bacterium]|nr:GerMN domain-containing protein [Spirochaetaceae bacterium]
MKIRSIFQGMGVCIFLILILVVSIFLYNSENLGKRRVLYFEAVDGSGLYIESRRITEYSSTQGRAVHVQQFVQELLLGPVTNGFKSLFLQGTRLESCFVQENILFINLSKEALFPSATTSATKDGVNLLVYNIKKNFSWIESVEIYIDGNKVYENIV